MPLHFTECARENCFTWSDGQGGETTFAVDRIPAWAEANGLTVFNTPVTEEWGREFCRVRGIEKHRIERLSLEALKTPVIYCHMPDNTHLLIDGSHRYVYAAALGLPSLPAYILEPDQWEQFVIVGLPKIGENTLLTMFSGIS